MRKLLPLMFLVLLNLHVFSQVSEGGTPVSFSKQIPNQNIDELYVEPLDFNEVDLEDEIRAQNGELPLIGRTINVSANVFDNGTWTSFKDGSRLWRLKITSPGAEALIVNYSSFKLSYGASLFLYSEDKSFVIGAFTYKNNRKNNFTTQMTPGETVILEYCQPAGVFVEPEINIESIAYIYKDSGFKNQEKGFGSSESCEINVNCSPEGDNAQDQKRGVVRIYVVGPSGGGWCSGSLINTTNGDCTPYVLTADHCGHDATTSNLTQWVFYFNYESPDCNNPGSEGTLANQTVTGCTLIANGGNTGDEGSDFFLIETTDPVPDTYNAFWNGWDRENTGSPSGYSIHHPAGDIKKISHYSTTLTTDGWNGSGLPSHWKVTWSTTTNGWGVTEGRWFFRFSNF